MKEITFDIPKGYVVDKEKSTDEKLVYCLKEDNREKFLLDIFNGMILKLNKDFPDMVYYKNKDGKYLFEHNLKNGTLYVSYSNIWSIFEKKYNMKHNEIQVFIKDMVCKHLNWKECAPILIYCL